MKRGGFGGGRAPRGSTSNAPEPMWDQRGWGAPEQSSSRAGWGRERDKDSGWSDRRRATTTGNEWGASPPNDEAKGGGGGWSVPGAGENSEGWHAPAVESMPGTNDSGWGDIPGFRKPEASGWMTTTTTTTTTDGDPKKGVGSAAPAPAVGETNAWHAPDAHGNPGRGSPRKPSFDSGPSSRRDRDPVTVDKGKGRADAGHSSTSHFRRPSNSWSGLDARTADPDAYRGGPDHPRPPLSTREPRHSTKDDMLPPQDDQPTTDWSEVQRHRQRPSSPTGTDNTANTEKLMAKVSLPSSVVNPNDKWCQMIA